MKRKDTQFDFINFAYGTGAAVVIIGAMFKFLGWDYANEFFLVGLTTEAVVFTISAFEYKSREDEEDEKVYNWENVFPELLNEKNANSETLAVLTKMSEANAVGVAAISQSIEQFNQAISNLNSVTGNLSRSMATMASHIEKIENTSEGYALEMQKLKNSVAQVAEIKNSHATNLSTLLPAYEKEYVDITGSLATINKKYTHLNETFDRSSSEYEKEFTSLVQKMSELNAFYADMLNAAGRNR